VLLFQYSFIECDRHKELDDLKTYMFETMCMLEMCFSPSFLYVRTLIDTSRRSDPHIGSTILYIVCFHMSGFWQF
jgi:hypothetical protein